ACLMLAATLMRAGLMVFETQEPHRPRWRGLGRNLRWFYGSLFAGTVIGIVLLIDISTDFQAALAFNLRSLYLEEVVKLGPQQRGLLFTVSGIAAMPAMVLGGWLGDKIGEVRTILIGVLVGALGYLLFPYQRSVLGLAVPFACWGLMGGMLDPTFRALISKVTPRERLATAFGTIIGSVNLVSFPAAHLGPFIYDKLDPQMPFLIAGIAQGVVFLALLGASGWLARRIAAEQALVGETVLQ
ncbi:MAG TPA: MFS transporter, partial [bacterium]|nr:MFS transporter [bacterium]